ncbi:TPA: hypothetical protein PC537_001019 [Morganella morganii]|nr:hypothetical protein [Morganella morganii]
MDTDLSLRLKKILDAAVFYNGALEVYNEAVKLLDEFNGLINDKNRNEMLILLNEYHLRGNDETSDRILSLISAIGNNKLAMLAKEIKLKLSLKWPIFMFNKSLRAELSPYNILSIYFDANELTSRFSYNSECNLNPIFERLTKLECFLEGNLFFKFLVIIKSEKNGKCIKIFYDDQKTSYRQAMYLALKINENRGVHEIFNERKLFVNFRSYSGILATLSFLKENRDMGIKKSAYYEYVLKRHPSCIQLGFSDIRILVRGSEKLDELKKILKGIYEIDNYGDPDVSRNFNELKVSKCHNVNDKVEPNILLHSALSSYVAFYLFILLNVDFIKELEKFKLILECEEVKKNQINFGLAMLFNNINDDVSNIKGGGYNDEVSRIQSKYHSEIEYLNTFNVTKKHWGYFVKPYFIYDLMTIIKALGYIYNKCGGDYKNITHEQFNIEELGINRESFIRASLVPNILGNTGEITYSGYMVGEKGVVNIMPLNNGSNILESIRAALILHEGNFRTKYLQSITLSNSISNIEAILWGLYNVFENKVSENKISDSDTMKTLDKLYKDTISERRYRKGKNIVNKIIKDKNKSQFS